MTFGERQQVDVDLSGLAINFLLQRRAQAQQRGVEIFRSLELARNVFHDIRHAVAGTILRILQGVPTLQAVVNMKVIHDVRFFQAMRMKQRAGNAAGNLHHIARQQRRTAAGCQQERDDSSHRHA